MSEMPYESGYTPDELSVHVDQLDMARSELLRACDQYAGAPTPELRETLYAHHGRSVAAMRFATEELAATSSADECVACVTTLLLGDDLERTTYMNEQIADTLPELKNPTDESEFIANLKRAVHVTQVFDPPLQDCADEVRKYVANYYSETFGVPFDFAEKIAHSFDATGHHGLTNFLTRMDEAHARRTIVRAKLPPDFPSSN